VPELLLDATLPFAPTTGSVVVTAGGVVLARRVRSADAPTARFVAPRAGTQLGRGRTTIVRWRAHDADGDPLTAAVDYSPDGGRHWTVVADRLKGSSAIVPSQFLSASRNARLRVRISDGFDVTTILSGRLSARGVPPVVQIIGAPRRGHVLATATLLLRGSAFDDAGRPITGRHLRWYLGRRLIGFGERVTESNLTSGATMIRLVATDARGRSAQSSLPLRVSAVAAHYLVFDAPLLVSTRARSIRIEVAATAKAAFTIAGRRYSVGPQLRAITVRIRPGKSLLRFDASLRSPGGVDRGTYFVFRAR